MYLYLYCYHLYLHLYLYLYLCKNVLVSVNKCEQCEYKSVSRDQFHVRVAHGHSKV